MANTNHDSALLTVGSVAFDSVETPTGAVERALGGSATYAALSASYFTTSRVVAVVGEDFGEEEREKFRTQGVDTRGIETMPGKTFHWKGRYHENMVDRDTLDTQLNVFESFDPKVPDEFRESAFVFLGNIHPRIQMQVLDQVKAARFVGMDTMNFWISSALDDLKTALARVDMLFINDEEALQLTGERQMQNAAAKILSFGPKYTVIKRGEFGALLFGPELCLFVPAVLLPSVVDPTGAGDAFAGGFLGSTARAGEITRRTLAQGMLSGTVMASYVVENFSVDGLIGRSAESIDSRRELLESMMNYR